MDAMAAFIRKHFEIDEDNSQDTSVRLQPAEFGYRSVHLIVQVKDAEILGIALSKVIGGRKAEIQVRTVVQHAWAEVSHDLIYKSAFTVPEELKRDCNRIAALLENADKAFGHPLQPRLLRMRVGEHEPGEITFGGGIQPRSQSKLH